MIVITLDYDKDLVMVEGNPRPIHFTDLDRVRELLIIVMNAAYFSGEAISLQEKRDSCYSEVVRW